MIEHEEASPWGVPAKFSEHAPGDHIRYRLSGAGAPDLAGEIIAIAGPEVLMSQQVPTRYIVQRDGAGDTFPDIVFLSDVIQVEERGEAC